jgi:hypothetical protein
LLNPTGQGARFANRKLETGITDLGDTQYYYFFNGSDTETINTSSSKLSMPFLVIDHEPKKAAGDWLPFS